jgi:phenylpropionate dioxygenase-like ring-hydroxylating dioxygenase large terminal subunit
MKEMLCDMNQTTQPIRPHKVFNNWDVVALGWYVVCKSSDLKKGKALPIRICGHELALYRTESGKAVALDKFCPHMGMSLAEGLVKGEHLTCIFHEWKFNSSGKCIDIPCLKKKVENGKSVNSYPVEEKYGMIWVYSDKEANGPVFEIDELKGKPILFTTLKPFRRIAHPHITMMNSIDEQHMRSVHKLPMDLDTTIEEKGTRFKVTFTGKVLDQTLTGKMQKFFLGDKWKSSVLFVDGCLGLLTIMIDLKLFKKFNLPCGYFIFSQTFTEKGETLVWPIMVTEQRPGIHGFIFSWLLIRAHKALMWFLAFQDGRVIYKNLRFNHSGLLPEIDNASAKWISFVNRVIKPSIWSRSRINEQKETIQEDIAVNA